MSNMLRVGSPADHAGVGGLPHNGTAQPSGTFLMNLNVKRQSIPAGGKTSICGRNSLLLLFCELQAHLFELLTIFL